MDEVLLKHTDDRFATNRLGAYAEAKVILRAVERGVVLLKPMMECRYDFVLDDGLKLYARR